MDKEYGLLTPQFPLIIIKSKLTKEEAEENNSCLVNICWIRLHLRDSAVKTARLLTGLERISFEKHGSVHREQQKPKIGILDQYALDPENSHQSSATVLGPIACYNNGLENKPLSEI